MTIFILHRASHRIKKVRVPPLGRGARSKVSFILPHKLTVTGPINVFAKRLGEEKGAAHSICTLVGPKHRNFCMSNWNVTSLNAKEQELVWKAEQYHLDIVEVSSTKYRDSDTADLNKLRPKETLTLTERKDVCYNSVPPTNCA